VNRYNKITLGALYYTGKDAKKNFIADICEELQTIKKNITQKPQSWKEHFHIEPSFFVQEFWEFEITIYSDKFVVEDCFLTFLRTNKHCRFCCNPNSHGELDNVFRNITEFRAFITREINKEEEQQ
jgi:hypothetical protein